MADDVLDDVLADLTAEGDRLELLVEDLTEEQWRTATPAAGWDIATQVAHLAWTAEVMGAIGNPEGYVDERALTGGAVDPEDLLERWSQARAALVKVLREVPAGDNLPWFGPPMSPTSMATARLMETWAHSLDVHEA